jgi:ABC-type multidrug transport system ATPase subunit
MDSEGRKKVIELMRCYCEEFQTSIIVSTHDICEAEEYCDRVSILKDGILKQTGSPNNLAFEKQHEFYLLTLNFPQNANLFLVQILKSQVKEYMNELTYVLFEREDRLTIAYSLDLTKINIIEVWWKIYTDFYTPGKVERFSLRRHGLL